MNFVTYIGLLVNKKLNINNHGKDCTYIILVKIICLK